MLIVLTSSRLGVVIFWCHRVNWQRVEQFVAPVFLRVVDGLVQIQVLTHYYRVGGVVGVESAATILEHQNDQTLLPLLDHVVIKRNFEQIPTSRAVNTR